MRRHRSWFFAAALITLLADQVSKSLVRAWLPLGSSIPVLPNALHITHTQNPGAAFGLFPNATVLLIVIALFVSAIFLWLGRQGFDRRRVAVATGMMLGGAVGNLIDRVRFGAVTDFIDLRVWPIFNLADAALTIGALLLLWWGAVAPTRETQKGNENTEFVDGDLKSEHSR
ncbi:MAG: signal peptidase II [Armatimonadetes bacterium]|nr:signal peptidase II [Armatimonadota bacterium]